jgi:hypothetical protein
MKSKIEFFFITSMIALFTSSSIKKIETFYEGDLRFFYGLTLFISNISINMFVIAFAAILLMLIHLLSFAKGLLKPSNPSLYYLAFKALSLLILLAYNLIDSSYVISFIFLIILVFFISSWQFIFSNFIELFSLSVFVFSIFFVGINFYEYFFNYEASVWGMRMYGVTNHPNFLGGYSMVMFSFSLLFCFIGNRHISIVAFFVSISLFLLILMSGSRSSLLGLFCAAVAFSVRANYVKEMFTAIVFAMLMLFLLAVLDLGGVSEYLGFERLLMTDNTRDYVTYELLSVFSENIIFGNPVFVQSTSNSFLSAGARYGIFSLLLLISSYLYGIYTLVRMKFPGSNYYLATFTSLMFGILPYSIFEGVLVESFSFALIIYFVTLCTCQRKFYAGKR